MRIALRLEYDGTDFHGSQLQASDRTVQGVLEQALESLFKTAIRPQLASRTDSGVHAGDQVAAFNVETYLDMNTIREALNHYLPPDAVARSVHRVHEQFDPRRDATRREYTYTINNSAIASPITRRFETTVHPHLDESRMNDAADILVGSHDFASFAGPKVPADSPTRRDMESASATREGDRVIIRFKANAFLHQQVRRMTGALIEAGKPSAGPKSIPESFENIRNLLNRPERGAATRLMAPQGLCLTRIDYPETGSAALPA
ncbi:MAG: tRNA pseudouridine(38-40) synthase TruA [Chloroflexi bacterium]|nr:tRNA pseudouridine(38-40) synthase TruA [Chloroflexota bacterium]